MNHDVEVTNKILKIIDYKLYIITFNYQTVHGTPTETRKSAKVAFSQIQKVAMTIMMMIMIAMMMMVVMTMILLMIAMFIHIRYISSHPTSALWEILFLDNGQIASDINALHHRHDICQIFYTSTFPKFHPSGYNFTLAVLVMLLTDINSLHQQKHCSCFTA